jgi:hypothetical protein
METSSKNIPITVINETVLFGKISEYKTNDVLVL